MDAAYSGSSAGWLRGSAPPALAWATPAAISAQIGQKLSCPTWMQNHSSCRSTSHVNSVLLTKIMISDAPKYTKTNVFWDFAPGPRCRESLQRSPRRLTGWERTAAPPQEPNPHSRLFRQRDSALWTLLKKSPLLMHTTLTTSRAQTIKYDMTRHNALHKSIALKLSHEST